MNNNVLCIFDLKNKFSNKKSLHGFIFLRTQLYLKLSDTILMIGIRITGASAVGSVGSFCLNLTVQGLGCLFTAESS